MLTAKAARGAVLLILSRLIGRAIDFMTLLVLARILGPADFGIAALAMTLVNTIDMVLEVPVTQTLIQIKHIDRSHLDTGFTIGLLRGSLLTIIIIAMAWPFSVLNNDKHLVAILWILAIGPAARSLINPSIANFARDLRYAQTLIVEISGKICGALVAIVIVVNNGSYWAIVANYIATSVAAVVVSYVISPYQPRLSLAKFSDFSRFVGWLSLSQLVSALNWQGDRFLVGVLAGKASLGRYAVANDLAVFPTQSLIGPALQPVMAGFSRINSETERLQLAFMNAARLTMLVSMPISFGIALTSDFLTELLFGPKWHEAIPLLQLLALSVVLIPYSQCLSALGFALGRTKIIFYLNLLDIITRSVLLPIGFLIASVEGACVARVIISMVTFLFSLFFVKHLISINVRQQLFTLWKAAVSTAAMVLGVILIRYHFKFTDYPIFINLSIVAAAGAMIYGATLALLGVRLRISATRLELVDRLS